jgi:hypothetical protein
LICTLNTFIEKLGERETFLCICVYLVQFIL